MKENMIIFCSVGRDQYGTNGRYAIYAMNRVAYLPACIRTSKGNSSFKPDSGS